MTIAFAPWALLPGGWASDVRLTIDDDGSFAEITPGASASGARALPGAVVPGMVDAHCHGFQRAFAAATQRRGDGDDSFWTWRRTMYAGLAALGADEFETVTFERYTALLRGGYTSVVEFHYVHRAPDGTWYPDRNELAHRVVRAAERAGIGLTLLPVFYAHGDAGGAPPSPEQHRFVSDLDGFAERWDALHARYGDGEVRLGVAPHSVRAATPGEIAGLVRDVRRRDATAPVHVHAAEQRAEVERSREAYGATPIAAIAAGVPLDAHWSIVHATHASAEEIALVAAARATAVICPTTEADLGDGLAPAEALDARGVALALGSDSGVGVDAFVEARWLEWGARLATGRRAVLGDAAEPSVATALWRTCAAGGARAAGRPVGALAPGARADLLVLDGTTPEALDAALFVHGAASVREVVVGGVSRRSSL